MKTIKHLSIILLTTVLLSSCGIHGANVLNTNNNLTNVTLSEKNFRVIDKVSGQSSAVYIFGIGGLSNKAMIENAKAVMLANANLKGYAKAIVNVTTENHYTLVFPFYFRKTVTVSAHVVEFIQ